MNPTAIYSKTGKGVQEASGKTSALSRGDRAVLAQIDGKTTFADLQVKFDKMSPEKLEALILQLDKDGFVREVASSALEPPAPIPGRTAARPQARPGKGPKGAGEELDFTSIMPASSLPKQVDLAAQARAEAEAKAKEQQMADYRAREEAAAKARAEAEAKVRAEADAAVKAAREAAVRAAAEAKARLEAQLKSRLEEERKAREEAERKAKEEAERAAREAAERERERSEQARREAEELRRQLEEERKAREESERKAKEEAERRAKEEAERKAKEEAERKAREEAERKAKEEADRKAKEDAERRAKEEAERKAREEADRKAKEDAERRAKEEAERKAREEADRKTKEEAERKAQEEADRKAQEEADRKAQEEADRKAKEDTERRAKEEAERKAKEETERKAREEAERKAKEEAERKTKEDAERARREREERARKKIEAGEAATKAAEKTPSLSDTDAALFADLNAFAQREEEERKAKADAERKAKEEVERREEERRKREEEEARRKAEEMRRRREEAERAREQQRLAKEEAERKEREEAERKEKEAAEAKKKAAEAWAAKKAETTARQDVEVRDEDLDMEDVKRDQKALAESRRREREREREEQRKEPAAVAAPAAGRGLGKKAAIAVVVLLVAAVGAVHVMPISTGEYEKAASQALGVPVKIGSARFSLVPGPQLKFERVTVGEAARVGVVRADTGIGAAFGTQSSFSRVELENAVIDQNRLGAALFGGGAGGELNIGAIAGKQVKLEGPIEVPPLDFEASMAAGKVQSVAASSPDGLQVRLEAKAGDVTFQVTGGSLAVPFVPGLSLSDFSMKGSATSKGMNVAAFDGRVFEGVVSGTASIQWGDAWSVGGDLRVRGLNVAVFAPALISEGRVEGQGRYAMSGPAPGKLGGNARVEGNYKIERGVLGSFDLARAIQSGGQTAGRTPFAELVGRGVYDKGAVQLRNVAITAGALSASASVDISAEGAIAGQISVDMKTLRGNLALGGTIQDPMVRR